MVEYVEKQKLLNDTKIRKDDSGVVRTRKLVFRNYIKSLPTADVVEREKIDKAIEEMKVEIYCDNGFSQGVRRAMEILERNIGE